MFHQFEPIGEENTFQEFCKDLLNLLHKTTSFQLYKEKGAEQHGIDNYSTDIRIVSQSKKKKLTRADKTLEKELIQDFDDSLALLSGLPFSFDKFILFSNTKKYGNVQNHAIQLSQSSSFGVEFWSWDDIQPKIIEFEGLRKKYYPHLWQTSNNNIPKLLTHTPKINETEIIGRSEELTQLENLLNVSNKVVLVNGMGGVGKSSLAKLFINKHIESFTHVAWIDILNLELPDANKNVLIIDAFANNIVLQSNLSIDFKEDISIEDKCSVVLNKLQNISGKNILIIDNAPASVLSFNDKLPGVPYWKVLLTSREQITDYTSLNLEVLNDEDAKRLFYQYYKVEQNDQIEDVIRYVGNHTLTIELLAKTASKRRFNIPALVNALEKEGLNISKAVKVTVDHDIEREAVKPFDYLLKIFSIADITSDQQDILRYFSVLPAQFIMYDDLKILLQIPEDDTDFYENITELTAKGWIKEETGTYQIHQVIQEVIKHKLKPELSNCINVVQGAVELISYEYKESFVTKVPYLEIAETLIKNLYRGEPEFYSLLNNLATIQDYNGNSLEAIKLYEELIIINQRRELNDHWQYYVNIAVSWLRLGDYSKALSYNLKAVKYLETAIEYANSLELAMTYNNTAENYRHLGQIHKALEFNLKAINIFESTEVGRNHAELATAYNNLSNSYSSLDKRKLSLKYGLKATELREQILAKDHPYLAQSYNNLGVDYEKLGRFDESLMYHTKAIKIREEIYRSPHYDLAESYNNIAELYRAKGDFNDAISYHQKSINIREAVFQVDHPEISMAYGNLAGVYLFKGDFENGKRAFETAINMRSRSGHKDPYLAIYYLNYASIHFMENNANTALTMIDNSLDIYSKLNLKKHPNYKLGLQIKERINSQKLQTQSQVILKTKMGRNDQCYCGSGKKYKKCHGKNS